MEFHTRNAHMQDLIEQVRLAARSDHTILIQGESGTGKEVLANFIHSVSSRSDKPFVKVDCTAIPSDLWESELFGYTPGAFTGASQRGKLGKFDMADGGTVFLDEIGDVPLMLQSKLLRVLQDRSFERVGGVRPQHADVRIIAATNRDLVKLRQSGAFREDLYHRLNQFTFQIPPLRERKEDIELLTAHFLQRAGGSHITSAAAASLLLYSWPGNVRELENAISRALILSEGAGVVDLKHLPPEVAGSLPTAPIKASYKRYMRGAEKQFIQWALRECNGDRTAAARHIGISRAALYKKLNLHPELKGPLTE